MSSDPLVRDVRSRLSSPRDVCKLLGLKVEHDARSFCLVCCPHPEHSDSKPSCSVHQREQSIAVKCHACGWSGDVLHLIAMVRGLDIKRDFREVLAIAAELAGLHQQAEAVRAGREPAPVPERSTVAPAEPERDYPPSAEVAALWESTIAVTEDAETSAMLRERGIDPAAVASASLARVLRPDTHPTRIPGWARYTGNWAVSRPWTKTGHRMLLMAYDCNGAVRSVRAWRVVDAETPKRLPPSGFRASGLVTANRAGVRWLQGFRAARIVICEGEPDMLARSIASPCEVVVGIGSGSWNDGFAARIPFGAEVDVLTHLDAAGDRYAKQIIRSLSGRANIRRWSMEAA